jgi:phosphoribosyl 1,2-cyclic phosphate phosphodiesterase
MHLTFLGTGTSFGVPIIGCHCAVCTSADPRNHRTRTAALLDIAGQRVLIDAGPDFRTQALRVGLERLDAVLLTHAHMDHIAGLDDLRPLNMRHGHATPIYGAADTLSAVRRRYDYAFVEGSVGSTRPLLELCEITPTVAFTIGGVPVLPVSVHHGTWQILGFRIGRLGYITDASFIPPASCAALQGLDLLVLNALRHEPHPTHLSLAGAVELIAQLAPARALLVHMGHDLEHEATNAELPAHVRLAYDGLMVTVDE